MKEVEIAKMCRSKKVSCQDTIHEYDEDDNLTMDRVGRYLIININLQLVLSLPQMATLLNYLFLKCPKKILMLKYLSKYVNILYFTNYF